MNVDLTLFLVWLSQMEQSVIYIDVNIWKMEKRFF